MMRHFTPSISNDIPSMGSGITSLNPTRKHKSYFYVLPFRTISRSLISHAVQVMVRAQVAGYIPLPSKLQNHKI